MRELLLRGHHKVVVSDCLTELRRCADKTFDMVLADLPYGQTKNSWDEPIDLEEFWRLIHRVTKPSAAIVLFAQGMFTAELMFSNRKQWRYNLVWQKDRPSGYLNAKRMPMRDHEDMLIFYRKLPIYNPQFWVGEPLHSAGKGRARGDKSLNYGAHGVVTGEDRAGETKKYPRSVLFFPKHHPAIHPTQKPVDLCKWLIETYTNPGDLILDPCAGSGTVGLAAKRTGRKSYSIELNSEYAQLAARRIRDA